MPLGLSAPLNIFRESTINNSFSIERLDNRAMNSDFPGRLSYHRILLVEKGRGSITVDGGTFEVHGEEVFLLAKGQIYIFKASSVVTGYVICFGDCFWEKAPASASNCKAVLFNNAAVNQCLQPEENELQELQLLFQALLREYEAPAYNNQVDAMAAYLKIIMIKLANVRMTEEATFDSQDYVLYRKFLDLLSAQYKQLHEVSDYAEMLGVAPRRLSDLCRRCCRNSAKELITGQIVAEAKRALQFSASPVKEIAYLLNFSSPEQFSHFFKKNTHFSPASYRSQFISIGQ
ncbi:AraC-type DNA-binding protein [Filimonas lacunae]|uniref:AraC-type DNA-binding protein n=1 Tax=Filimonas lacunae TaxID=477680 RepID=A0A173MBM8_9BACT|nr:AraC family transcriptional regulator [Filimonas lacunae]BAV04891.1 transcriptional regulator, AraC family [Filimonas lacunae]SIT33842.1 AraC-type DNA-binding protein [Filimonas lacunae]